MVRTKANTSILVSAASAVALSLAGSPAFGEEMKQFDIEAQPLAKALLAFNEQSGLTVAAPRNLVEGKASPAVHGEMEPEEALEKILADSGLKSTELPNGAYTITFASAEAEDRGAPFRVAQATQEDAEPLERAPDAKEKAEKDVIVVTGTNIRGVAPESTPTLSFDQEDIRATGAPNLPQFLRTIPQNFSGGNQEENRGLNPPNNGGGLEGGASVNLRGFGDGRTLSLVNNRRISADAGTGTAVDVSIIPIAAIERVEIVTAGASSIYGSDAVGGVINFILRDDFEGAETNLAVGTLTDGGGTTVNANQALGAAWRGGNAFVTYDFFAQDPLLAADRDFTSPEIADTTLIPDIVRHSVFAAARQNIGGNAELFAEAYYVRSDTDRVTNLSFQSLLMEEEARREAYGGTLGVNYEFSESWSGEVYASHSRVDRSFEQFDVAAGAIRSPTPLEDEVHTTVVEGKANGSLFAAPGGEVKVALGSQGRFENLLSETATRTGEFDSSIFAVFGEAYVPFVGPANARPGIRQLDLTVSGRYESFDGESDSIDPQVGLVWSPSESVKLRANWGTSFRAPTLTERNGPHGPPAVLTFLTIPGAESPTPATLFLQGFARDLDVEESEFWTAGFDYSPQLGAGDVNLSFTYFNIDLTNEVDAPVFVTDLSDPRVASVVQLDPTPAQIDEALTSSDVDRTFLDSLLAARGLVFDDIEAIYDFRRSNIARRETSGFDVNVLYSVSTGLGEFGAGINSTYLTKYDVTPSVGEEPFSLLDLVFQPLDWRMRGNVSWAYKGASAYLFVNYADDYVDDRGAADVRIDSFTTIDFTLAYEFDQGASDILKESRIAVSVQNLFDADPPFVDNGSLVYDGSSGYDAINASARGRFVGVQLTKNW